MIMRLTTLSFGSDDILHGAPRAHPNAAELTSGVNTSIVFGTMLRIQGNEVSRVNELQPAYQVQAGWQAGRQSTDLLT